MLFLVLVVSLALLGPSFAHFSVVNPYWRGDSYATQWERPCGGVNQSISDANRTEWPIDGGSLVFRGSHAWTYTFVNLGLGGDNTTTFNITLVEGFNQTGNGTFCFPKVTLPADLSITPGMNASIQVVQVNERGSSLYNCADITFSDTAEVLGTDECFNSTGVGGSFFATDATGSSNNESSSNNDSSSTGAGAKDAIFTSSTVITGLASLALLLL